MKNHDNGICVMDGVTENEKVLQWLERRNREVHVRIDRAVQGPEGLAI